MSCAVGLVVGVLADRVLGDPPKFHPVAGFGRVADRLERAAWRPTRRTGAWYVATLVAVPMLAAGAGPNAGRSTGAPRGIHRHGDLGGSGRSVT